MSEFNENQIIDSEQVEAKKESFNTAQRIEEMGEDDFKKYEEVDASIDYEDEDEAAMELSDWDV